MSMRMIFSILTGLIALALGAIPILNKLGLIGFSLPFTVPGLVLAILMVIGAIVLFVDASDASADFVQWGAIISGIIIIVLGSGMIVGMFVPSVANITNMITSIPIIMELLLIISGFFLIVGGIMGY